MVKIRFEGPKSIIDELERELQRAPDSDISVEDKGELPANPLRRRPLGLEPITYFVVAFAAHLTAALAHDLITKKAGAVLGKYKKTIRVNVDSSD